VPDGMVRIVDCYAVAGFPGFKDREQRRKSENPLPALNFFRAVLPSKSGGGAQGICARLGVDRLTVVSVRWSV
jgi:hypothetical protein